jgi:putative flippase GtrA
MISRVKALITDKSVQRFVAVGLISFAIDYGLLLILHKVFSVELTISTTLAYLTGLIVNFMLNKLWTFSAPKGAKQSMRQALLYAALVVVNLLFTDVVVNVAQSWSIGPELSKPLATGAITILNYVVYNRIIFKQEPPVEPFAG